ncbi:hypothetical protein QE152_g32338 [Popillia japonica]|uniref:Uncharacterized protein n=1 Tax=Popillia japonica TaxID=7064 RepID=A0AAW1J049_POPJA
MNLYIYIYILITIILINVVDNLPHAIVCDDEGNKEKCFQAFERVCPQHFIIEKVIFMKFSTAPVCRVRVEYKPENDDLPGEGEALKTLMSNPSAFARVLGYNNR